MPNLINIRNLDDENLTIKIVPKDGASSVSFKNGLPFNGIQNEDGSVTFTLSTVKNDRVSLFHTLDVGGYLRVTDINGVEVSGNIAGSFNDESGGENYMSTYDLAQVGIHANYFKGDVLVDGSYKAGGGTCLYNANSNKTIVINGEIDSETSDNLDIYNVALEQAINDPALINTTFVQEDGKWGMVLGDNTSPYGNTVIWQSYLPDDDSEYLSATLKFKMVVNLPAEFSIPPFTIEADVVVERESVETPWLDEIDFDGLSLELIDNLNIAFINNVPEDFPINELFGDAHLSPFTMYLSYMDNAPYSWLNNVALDDSEIDGPIALPPPMMAMSLSGESMGEGDMAAGVESSNMFFICVAGAPYINPIVTLPPLDGSMIEGSLPEGPMSGGDELIAANITLEFQAGALDNVPEGEWIINGANNQWSEAGIWGDDCINWTVRSASFLANLPPPPLDEGSMSQT